MKNNNQQFRVSPSKIGQLLECPKCLWLFYREGLNRPEGIFPTLLNGMDGLFKNYFDKYRNNGILPPEIAGKVEGRLFEDAEKLKQWQNRSKGLQAEFPEFNILLKGLIDDLLVTSDNKYIPFDFKSRGYPIKENTHNFYQNQLDLYALLFEKNDLPSANFGYLLFFYPTNYNQGAAEFKTELVKMGVSHRRAYEILKKVHQIISGPKPASDRECIYCQYRNRV
ncbi:MAG: PD-(D/E)XK nuclease family protein [Candidatus Nealsonbacteria bacterium]|nr:PD-(D/E)XK nuclease family protein [Candidatus Nealsonbacteria bacterium]